jgi:MFS family permease
MDSPRRDSASATQASDMNKDIFKSPSLTGMNSVSPGEMGEISRMPESLRELSADEMASLNKKLVRKMDLVILPIIGILYILNYVDRQNLSAAKLQGITDDLHMTTQQFATAISILFVGYLPFQIPSNLLITKIPRPGMYICTATVIWGGISGATAAVQSYRQLLAVRIILGVVEAVFFPGAVYFLSAWYTKKELGKRLAGLYIAQQVGNAFGGLFAAAIFQLDGVHGIAGWRWLFIIEGSATVGIGSICTFFMPEYPHNAKMLTNFEKDLAVWRIESEAGAAEGTENEKVLKSFIQALADPKLILLIFCNMMSQAQGSIANYFPTPALCTMASPSTPTARTRCTRSSCAASQSLAQCTSSPWLPPTSALATSP